MKKEIRSIRTFVRRVSGCLLLCLCVFSGLLFSACSGPETQVSSDSHKEEEKKPLLDENATDEELLELIDEDINYVKKEDFGKVLAEIKKDTEKYSGQLYQFSGFFTEIKGNPYISESSAGSGKAGNRLPLRYLTDKPKEGAAVKITGVISLDEVDGKKTAVLDVVTVEADVS